MLRSGEEGYDKNVEEVMKREQERLRVATADQVVNFRVRDIFYTILLTPPHIYVPMSRHMADGRQYL
jgi:hypothetical protein